ncbi:hypothetical protein BS47DRAFT_48590 [Hydnum rufescens UP504]|uniref:Uncharacterized protein n=1 Tax=Hydnum rufescens UP504 TaxID=1448309 RepID=A0A9P6AS99_9AGAM|nr:hypothetical protein BS47DRAFT_48590 [Hydnum rufescens UP504]
MNFTVSPRPETPLALESRWLRTLHGSSATHAMPAPIAEISHSTSPLPSTPIIEVRGPSFDGEVPQTAIPPSPSHLSPDSPLARHRKIAALSETGFSQRLKAQSIVLTIDSPHWGLPSSSRPSGPRSFLDFDDDDDDDECENFEGVLEAEDTDAEDQWTLWSASSQDLHTPPPGYHGAHPLIYDFNEDECLPKDVEDLLDDIGWEFPIESPDPCHPMTSLPAPSASPSPKVYSGPSLALALDEESHVHLNLRASVYDPL